MQIQLGNYNFISYGNLDDNTTFGFLGNLDHNTISGFLGNLDDSTIFGFLETLYVASQTPSHGPSLSSTKGPFVIKLPRIDFDKINFEPLK